MGNFLLKSIPNRPEWEELADTGFTSNRQLKKIYQWGNGNPVEREEWAKWERIFKTAVDNYAEARGLDTNKMISEGHLLMQNNGDVPLQRLHRDFAVVALPTTDDSERAQRVQRARIATQNRGTSGRVKKEETETEINEILD